MLTELQEKALQESEAERRVCPEEEAVVATEYVTEEEQPMNWDTLDMDSYMTSVSSKVFALPQDIPTKMIPCCFEVHILRL